MKHIYHSPQLVLSTFCQQDVCTVSLMQDQGVGDMLWETTAPTTPTLMD